MFRIFLVLVMVGCPVQDFLDSRAITVYNTIAAPPFHTTVTARFWQSQRVAQSDGTWHVGNGPGYARAVAGMSLAHAWQYAERGKLSDIAQASHLLSTLVETHKSGIWNGVYTNVWTLHTIAYTAHWLWPALDPAIRTGIYNLLVAEANALSYLIDHDIRTTPFATVPEPGPNGEGIWTWWGSSWSNMIGQPMISLLMSQQRTSPPDDLWRYNSKAEETSGIAAFLAQVTEMFPDNPRAPTWKRVAKIAAFYALSTGESYTDDTGFTWPRGRTLDNKYRLYNHGWGPNWAYSASAIYSLTQAQFSCELFNRTVPSEYTHGVAEAYKANHATYNCEECPWGGDICEREVSVGWVPQDAQYDIAFLMYWNDTESRLRMRSITSSLDYWWPVPLGSMFEPHELQILIFNLEKFTQLAAKYSALRAWWSGNLDRTRFFPYILK